MKLRFVGISSSHKPDRTTTAMVHTALDASKDKVLSIDPNADVEIQFVSLAGKVIMPCTDCGACKRKGTLCIQTDDWLSCVEPIVHPCAPDGIILGSPVYFHSTNAQMRAFMERCTCLFKQVWHKEHPIPALDLTKTVAGAVSVGLHRNGGVEEAVCNMQSFLCSCGCIVVNSFDIAHGPIGYTGGTGWSDAPGVNNIDISLDEWGMLSAKILGERLGETSYYLKRGLEVS